MSDLFQMLVEAVRNTQRRPVNMQPVLIFAAQSEPKRKTHPPQRTTCIEARGQNQKSSPLA